MSHMSFNKGPHDDDGNPIHATTFENTLGLAPSWDGSQYSAQPAAVNIFDTLVPVEKRLRGGWYEIMDNNATSADYVEFAVVDKDDVLDLFQYYGYTVGEDVLELRKYVKKDYVNPLAAGTRQEFVGNSAFPIIAGLYLRSIYVSGGSNNVLFKAGILEYE